MAFGAFFFFFFGGGGGGVGGVRGSLSSAKAECTSLITQVLAIWASRGRARLFHVLTRPLTLNPKPSCAVFT